MSEQQDKQYKMRCVVCGASTGDGEPEEHIRTFTFGNADDEATVAAIVWVCTDHLKVPLPDVRRAFYNEVFQAREYENSPLRIVPHVEEI